MSAPLYARYRRYAEREAARFPRRSIVADMIPTWRRPDTRVYSLSERASHEAGWWSGNDPGELLRAMALHYLPLPRVWIELDWRAFSLGTNRLPLTPTSDAKMHFSGVEGIHGYDPIKAPLRLGLMLHQTEILHQNGGFHIPRDTILGYLFYLYPTGACFVGPPIFGWHATKPVTIPIEKVNTAATQFPTGRGLAGDWAAFGDGKSAKLRPEELAPGLSYSRRWEKDHPRLLHRLQSQMMLTTLRYGNHEPPWSEIEGTTRIALAALTAALSAKPAHGAAHDPKAAPVPTQKARGAERDRPIEVDLFIRERPRNPGQSLRASVGHLEGIKKGLHTVAGHYAYRARADGADPETCPINPLGIHDFEAVVSGKTEVCILCGQKRWFRAQHQRGDEAYGIVPQKVYNVRVGAPAPGKEVNSSANEHG